MVRRWCSASMVSPTPMRCIPGSMTMKSSSMPSTISRSTVTICVGLPLSMRKTNLAQVAHEALPSHGRGPRFDPLCAHHEKSLFYWAFCNFGTWRIRQLLAEQSRNSAPRPVENPWKKRPDVASPFARENREHLRRERTRSRPMRRLQLEHDPITQGGNASHYMQAHAKQDGA